MEEESRLGAKGMERLLEGSGREVDGDLDSPISRHVKNATRYVYSRS